LFFCFHLLNLFFIKNNLFHVTFNTYFLLQDISTLNHEKSSLGEVIIDSNSNTVVWKLQKKDIDMACKDKRFSSGMKLSFHFDRTSNEPIKTELSKKNLNAFENLHLTDDDGFYTQNNNIENNIKRPSNSAIFSSEKKVNISRSDSYVTARPVVFDIQNDELKNPNLNNNNNNNKEKICLKIKEDTRKILLTEQSHTSSETSESDSEILAGKQKIEVFKTTTTIKDDDYIKQDLQNVEAIVKETNNNNNKKVLSFFKKKSFFSLKKSNKLGKKYQRQRNNSNTHNDTLEENSQSYDLLSNSSNNKAASTNNLAEIVTQKHENKSDNDYDEVYDDDDDEIKQYDEKDDDFKIDKKNFKNFFSRIKQN
jgi:hypothetical protein